MGAGRQCLLYTDLYLRITMPQHQRPMASKIIHINVTIGVPFSRTKGLVYINAVGRSVARIVANGRGEKRPGPLGQGLAGRRPANIVVNNGGIAQHNITYQTVVSGADINTTVAAKSCGTIDGRTELEGCQGRRSVPG